MKKYYLITAVLVLVITYSIVVSKPPAPTEDQAPTIVAPKVDESEPLDIDVEKSASLAMGDELAPSPPLATGDVAAQNIAKLNSNRCTWRVEYRLNESGTTTPIHYCEKSETGQSDPYANFTNKELADLAYNDAIAAETLGVRLRDKDERAALDMFLRAAALSRDGGPLRLYHNIYPTPTFRNGEPVLRGIRARYFLLAVSEFIDGETGYSDSYRQTIREHFDDPNAEIDRLDSQRASKDSLKGNLFIVKLRRVRLALSYLGIALPGSTTKHLEFISDHLGRPSIVAITVLPFTCPKFSLDINLRALLKVFSRNFGKPAEEGNSVPFGSILLLTGLLVLPLFRRGN